MNDRSKTSRSHYDTVTILLHWTIGVGIIALGLLELLRHEFPKGTFVREGLKTLHQPAGTTLFALILIRIAWRATFATPPVAAATKGIAALAAKAVHLALYALMVALPLLGMLSVFAAGKSIDFGLFQIAAPLAGGIGVSPTLLKSMHEALALAILGLAFAHAAAALGHHYVLGDDVLTRMRLSRAAGHDRNPRAFPVPAMPS